MSALIYIKKQQENIFVQNYGGFESRNESSIKLVTEALKNVNKDTEFYISTDDRPRYNINGKRTFSYSTDNNNFQDTCPDFLFDRWYEVGINDYDEECAKLNLAGKDNHIISKIGWIGSGTDHLPARKLLLENSKKYPNILELHATSFTKNNLGVVQCHNFMTLEQQVKNWKYLIDVEGCGWSARLKLLLWSGRPTFIVDRPYKEFFYQFLEPWKHYIPIKQDFSDFEKNFSIVENDKNLYKLISEQSVFFAKTYLTRQAAISHWSSLF